MKGEKYFLQCNKCNYKIKDFADWFKYGQKCPDCNSLLVNVGYYDDMKKLIAMLRDKSFNPSSLWADRKSVV